VAAPKSIREHGSRYAALVKVCKMAGLTILPLTGVAGDRAAESMRTEYIVDVFGTSINVYADLHSTVRKPFGILNKL
jgi:hypothetical protein